MFRRTKILATLGPSTDDEEILDRLITAGVDVVRINLSHGTHSEHRRRIELVRNRAQASGRQVGVLMDLQGPKIRIGRFADGPINLEVDDKFILDGDLPLEAGNQERVGLTLPSLVDDVARGDTLLVNDGAIRLWVEGVEDRCVYCQVRIGGPLSDSKGINRLGGGLSAPALTEKDKKDLIFACEMSADYLAISFVSTAEDVRQARALMREAGGSADIVAKIERSEAMDNINDIIEESDVIMVARGDLGVEVGDAELPAIQKKLIKKARSRNRLVITATQMMESMISSPQPTRAEVFDVANAVHDGTDAVMLSGETAAGRYPAEAVTAMARIALEAETYDKVRKSRHRVNTTFGRVDESIAMAAMYTGNHLGVKAIASLTETGSTARWMSRISSDIPIYAMTRHVATRRKVTMFRGVCPVSFDFTSDKMAEINEEIINELMRRGAVRKGDLVIITKGDDYGVEGQTNIMKIMRVGDHNVN